MEMTLLVIVFVLLIALVAFKALETFFLWRQFGKPVDTPAGYIEHNERKTVAVHLKSGTSIRGVLVEVYEDAIVLRNAGAAPGSSSTKDFLEVDGEQAIPRGNVDWLQVIESGEQT